jgi:chromosomal replication initiator protein
LRERHGATNIANSVIAVTDGVDSAQNSLESGPEALWAGVSARLRDTVSETTFRTFFGTVRPLELTEDAFVVTVQNDFTRAWIQTHFLDLMGAAVRDATGQERQVRLTVESPKRPALAAAEHAAAEGGDDSAVAAKHTFDSFVIGSSNRFAVAAALSVAESPARAYNPLFIYGGTGLGKTHLLQAISHYVREHSRELSVRYVTSETFLNDFIDSLRDKRIEGFKQRYRNYDVLLIDDIQFFEHKERIQEEFFHTFNSLHGVGRQIVISSDRPPRELSTLEARLRSRFEWGLLTDIQPPDLETRIAILRKKVKTDNSRVPDEVLIFIAGRISTNIRVLEGALTRVVAFSSLTDRPMTTELAQEVLRDTFPEGEPASISVERIQQEVSEHFDISVRELTDHRRSQPIVYHRQVAMYLCRELTDSSLPKIGREFGGRDHTTVMYATSKIARLIRENRDVYDLVQALTARIRR